MKALLTPFSRDLELNLTVFNLALSFFSTLEWKHVIIAFTELKNYF